MRTFIIAEAGVNHNGSLEIAKQLIDVACKAGADCVKFQTFKTEKIVTRTAAKADYQQKNLKDNLSQFEMLKKLELSEQMHHELINHCRNKNILFMSTAFDETSIELLKSLSLKIGKIPSGEITNLPYLRLMAQHFPELILSTGMSDMKEIIDAVNILVKAGADKKYITVLHCTTEYPTPMSDVNLRAMLEIQRELEVNIGYSDHTPGIEIPIAAVALGATIIEKHFTIDRNMIGPDHAASLMPGELKAMITAIRNIEQALGNGLKTPSQSEAKNKAVARKSIVAAQKIDMGEVFTTANLTVKRPGTGISPMQWDNVLGKKAIRDFEPDELIEITANG